MLGLQHLVGRAPWPAADPLVGLLGRSKSRTRGSGADEGVRPTFGCGSVALWGSFVSCSADFIGALRALVLSPNRPVGNRPAGYNPAPLCP
jgi:hypothetical protein